MQLKKLAITALLVTFGVACQPVDKVAIYEKNNGKQPFQAELLAEIAVGYAKLGQQGKASKLLAPAIQTAKINKSTQIGLNLLEQLGSVYVEMGQYDKALQVAKSLQVYEPIDKDGRLKRITTRMVEVGQYEKALQVAKLISNTGVISNNSLATQSIAMSEVALPYAQTGKKTQAEQILVQALQKAKTSDEMAEIALKYAQVGQKAKALQVLAQALQNAQYPDNIDKAAKVARVAVKYAQVGQQAKGEQLLAQALQRIKKEDGATKEWNLPDIAIGYAKLGQFNQAIETTKSIKAYIGFHKDSPYIGFGKNMETPEESTKNQTSEVFAEIAKTCAAAGQYEQAFQAIQEIKSSYRQREALGVVAIEYAKKSQYEQAFQVLKENIRKEKDESISIVFNPNSAWALTKIVAQANQAESSAKAESVLSQALKVAKTIKYGKFENKYNKVEMLTAIAIEYAEIQQKDKSEELLAQALQIAENMDY